MCGVVPTSHPSEMPSMTPSTGPSDNPSSIPSFLSSFEPSVTLSEGPSSTSNNPVIEWQQIGQDIDGENDNDSSGGSVSLSSDGNTVAIGAHGNDRNGRTNAGHVRV